MAFDAFIKIEGIEGESSDDKHTGWIEVIACDAKVSQRVSSTASNAGGTHIDSIIIEFCRSGTEKITFM